MGSGASKKYQAPPAAEPPAAPEAAVAAAVATAAAAPKPAAPAQKPADGQASASQVVGGSWTPPKGPSPDDDKLVEEWKAEGKLHVLEGVWCHVPFKVTAVLGDDLLADAAAKAAAGTRAQEIMEGVADEAKRVFSHFEADSEVSAINALGAGASHKASPVMLKVLEAAGTLNRLTRGAFDPAILPLSRLYKDHSSSLTTPAGQDEVAAYSKWSMFRIENGDVTKTRAEAQLDLCGLAKGWAIDEIVARLKDAGFTSSYVDWGGDVKVCGRHPAGRNWTVAVVEPNSAEEAASGVQFQDSGSYIAHVELRDGQSMATSGDYMQKLALGLSHVIDPRKGKPVAISEESCASVSVVANSCLYADALATAAMACGTVKDGRRLLDLFRGASLKDPVADYLLYSRAGPRVCRLRDASAEAAQHREDRLSRHEPAYVVVLGGGLAGVCAAVEAFKARARVTIIEKESQLGGNSAKATSGINACGTRVQKENGVEDDGRYFERDTHVSATGGTSQVSCVSMLSEKSAEAIHWLMDELGIPLTALSQLGGHARKRTHRVPPRSDGAPVPVGYTMMEHARVVVEAMGIEVRTETVATRLLSEGEAVTGVEIKDSAGNLQELHCDSVVVTTGGFGFDHSEGSFMAKYRPDLIGVPTTNGSFANGDGIKFGAELGATLVDMDKVQLHPTAFIDPKDPGAHTKYLGPEALRGSGGLLLDQSGRRFVNELDLRSVVSNKILNHCEAYKLADGQEYRPWAWCVLADEAQEKFGRPMLRFYKDQVGLFEAVEGTKGLAELIGCDESNVIETLKEYAQACDSKICLKTGKSVFPSRVCETDQSFIVARITPCIHYCMGGLEISASAEVLTTAKAGAMGKRRKVPNLYAAGECTGGVHGGNRLGGNSLLECVVFGRIAGERAATVKQKSPTLLDSGEWLPVQLREIRDTDKKYGHNTKIYRFNLHGARQQTGLQVGRFIGIRGELDGDTLTGYYSPISRPEDEGVIDILCRTDDKGGPIVQLLQSLRPGASCLMKGMGGVQLQRHLELPNAWTCDGRMIQKLGLLCGGTGLAPAVQIARAYFNAISSSGIDPETLDPTTCGVRIVYAAEAAGDLAFVSHLDLLKQRFPKLISYYLFLNQPPSGWTQGVGFVDFDAIRQRLWFPPADDHLTVMCGPPIFEKIMSGNLSKLGYPREQYYSFSGDPNAQG